MNDPTEEDRPLLYAEEDEAPALRERVKALEAALEMFMDIPAPSPEIPGSYSAACEYEKACEAAVRAMKEDDDA